MIDLHKDLKIVLLIFLIAASVIFANAGQSETEEKHKSPLVLRESMINEPELCSALQRGFIERQVMETGFCGVPFPEGDQDFTFPNWVKVDAKEHVEIVEQMFLWGSVRYFNAYANREMSTKEYRNILRERVLPEEIVQRFLDPVKDELHNRLDEIILETAEFDLNLDGEKETVYRMNRVMRFQPHASDEDGNRLRNLGPLVINPISGCRNEGFPGQTESHFVYADPEKIPGIFYYLGRGLGGGSNSLHRELFFWRGQPYEIIAPYSISRIDPPQFGRLAASRQVCTFTTNLNSE